MVYKKPMQLKMLTVLYLALCVIIMLWAWYSYNMFTAIFGWGEPEATIDFVATNYFVFIFGLFVWTGIVILLLLLLYGLIKRYKWAWTTSLILTTFGLVILPIMLLSLMITLIKYQSTFASMGLITCFLAVLIDICIVYLLTTTKLKQYYRS